MILIIAELLTGNALPGDLRRIIPERVIYRVLYTSAPETGHASVHLLQR